MRARTTALLYIVVGLSLLVSYGFHLWYPVAHFDADQAIIGIMGKDLATGRSLPWTFYGQKYMLAVEAWVAALSFAVFGVSVASLKLPLLLLNMVTAFILVRLLRRDSGLKLWQAVLAVAPLIAPAIPLATLSMATIGANPWPLFYLALMWALRDRAVILGLLLGPAYFQREFVLVGFLALICTDVFETGSFTLGDRWRSRLATLLIAFASYHVLVGLGQFNAEFVGVGTPRPKLVSLTQLLENGKYLGGTLAPLLLGLSTVPTGMVELPSAVSVGPSGWAELNAVLVVTLTVIIGVTTLVALVRGRTKISGDRRLSLPLYLIIAACGQLALYLLFIAKNESVLARYILLLPAAVVGVTALAMILLPERSKFQWAVAAVALSLTGANIMQTARLWHDYLQDPLHHEHSRLRLATFLKANGYRYGWANYWDAYYISFVSDEAVILAGSDHSRVSRYHRLVSEHASEAVVLASPGDCADPAAKVFEGVAVCPLAQYRGVVHEAVGR